MKIVACMPAYNEEKTIAKIILLTQKHVDQVLVCDDGSTDLTAEIAEKMGATVISHKENMGKGAALRTLFKKAIEEQADIIVTLDSDGQHDPTEIPKLIEPILAGKADITIGHRLQSKEMPLYRRIGNKLLTALLRKAAKAPVLDTQSGFRAYSRKALQAITIDIDTMAVDSHIIVEATRKGLRVKEVPVKAAYKGLKHSTLNPITHFYTVAAYLLKLIAGKKPITWLGVPGTILVAAGFLAGLRVVKIFIENNYQIAVGTALIAVMLIILGFMLLTTATILYAIKETLKQA